MYAEEAAKRHANFIGINLAIFFAGIAGIALYYHLGGWLVFFVGVSVYGFSRCVFYLMLIWNGTAEPVVPEPRISPDLMIDDDEEDEEEPGSPEPAPARGNQRVEAAQESGRFYVLGRTQFNLPEDVKPQHLNIVLGARARGRLPDVTENKLNKIGISRFAMPPNARTTMAFLQKQGMIDKNGQWTTAGERYFPSPDNYNGQNGVV